MLEVRFQKPMKRNSKDSFIQKTLWQMSSTLGPLGGPLQVSNLKQPRAHCKTLLGLKGPCASHPTQGQMAWPHGLPWMGCSDIGTWGWNLDNYSKWLLNIKQIWTWISFTNGLIETWFRFQISSCIVNFCDGDGLISQTIVQWTLIYLFANKRHDHTRIICIGTPLKPPWMNPDLSICP